MFGILNTFIWQDSLKSWQNEGRKSHLSAGQPQTGPGTCTSGALPAEHQDPV